MKIGNLMLFSLVLLLNGTLSAGEQKEQRPITIDDFFNLKIIEDPQISQDGKWVAYTISESDLDKDKTETRIWMSPTKGGEAIPMTAKGYSASMPRWSHDGKYLSFIAKRSQSGEDNKDSDEQSQVWLLNRRGGEAQQLTKVKQGVSGYEWSPNGKRLVLLITDPKPYELTEDKKDDDKARPFVIDRLQFKQDFVGYLDRYRTHLYVFTMGSDNEPVQITSGDFDDSQPTWSPGGKSLAFVSNRTKEPDNNPNSDIWIVSADNSDKGATLLQLTTNIREDRSPVWSPDGKSIAYTTVTAAVKFLWYATEHLAIISSKGGEPKVLTSTVDRNVKEPTFSSNGKSIYFILEDSGEQILASIAVNGGGVNRHISGPMSVLSYAVNGDFVAALISQRDQAAEIFTLKSGKQSQLTFANEELFSQLNMAATENIHYKSKDGTEIEAFLTKPIGFNPAMKYPMILYPHGGPTSQYDYQFDFQAQLWAANGYLVLQPNPRGSTGYGQVFSYAIFADWGHLDFEDLMSGVDYVIEKGIADPDKLGVGGWSYGGILTNYVITQSTRFKGAVSGASEALFRSNYGHDHYQMWWEVELGLPWENVALWEKLSPFNNVAKITTPTLWIGGNQDWNVPILNSEQMYQAMKRLGGTTQLVVYPGEYHEISRPSFQKDCFERYVFWYNKYVKGVEITTVP